MPEVLGRGTPGKEDSQKRKMKVNIQKLWTLHGSTLTIEAWRLKMKPWRVCKPMVADLHNFYKEQAPDPDPDLHQCERIRNNI
jgi:hypothetical protein